MQNYDFAGKSSPPARNGRRYYKPVADFPPMGGPASGPTGGSRKSFSYFYTVLVFSFLGFSIGIATGLYLANTNDSVRSFLQGIGSGQSSQTVKNQPSVTKNISPGILPPEKELGLPAPEELKPNVGSGEKEFYIYAGIFRDEVAKHMLFKLREKHLPAYILRNKNGTKLYVGPYKDATIAQKELGKIKNFSNEYFGNAVIQVYNPTGKQKSS